MVIIGVGLHPGWVLGCHIHHDIADCFEPGTSQPWQGACGVYGGGIPCRTDDFGGLIVWFLIRSRVVLVVGGQTEVASLAFPHWPVAFSINLTIFRVLCSITILEQPAKIRNLILAIAAWRPAHRRS
jgi:hypothetical protein